MMRRHAATAASVCACAARNRSACAAASFALAGVRDRALSSAPTTACFATNSGSPAIAALKQLELQFIHKMFREGGVAAS